MLSQYLPNRFSRLILKVALCTATVATPIEATAQSEQTDRAVDVPKQTATAYEQLADSATAAALKLTDEQQQRIAEILKDRGAVRAAAAEEQRAAIDSETSSLLQDVLTPEQQETFASLFQKRLQFNFQYQKWEDVLEWIADAPGLSLVMDAPPAGTFNYSDTKEYSPTEAIDLLNGWLQTKGYALIRRDRLLMLVDVSEGVPLGAVPRVPLDELAARGRFELVSVLIPLEGRPAEGALAEIQPLLGRHGKAEALPQTKQLLVIDTAGNLRTIRELVASLPVPKSPPPAPKPPGPTLEVYPIEHANPAKVGEVLTELLSGTVVVDEQASQVTVNAVPDEQTRAKAVIAQLEANQGPDKQPRLETYPAPKRDAAEVTSTLQLVAPAAQIRLDGARQRIQVWASPQDQRKIRETLDTLGAPTGNGETAQLEVYTVTGVTPQAAMTALTAVMPDIRVTVDAGGHKLIVVGSLAEHQAVARLLQQLQSDDDPELAVTVQTYPLTNIDGGVMSLLSTLVPNAQVTVDEDGSKLVAVASGADHQRIQTILQQVGEDDPSLKRSLVSYPLDRKLDLAPVTSLLSKVAPKAEVTADPPNHRLLVVATDADHESIASTINQLAKDAGVAQPELRFFPIDKVDGSRAVSILQTLAPAAQLTFDPASKRLTSVATPADQEMVAQTLSKLEAVSRAPAKRVLNIYSVTSTQKSRFNTLAAGLSAELARMQVLSDAQPDELAIWAMPAEHDVVQDILDQLQRELPEDLKPTLVSYPIRKTDATSLSDVLGPLFPNVKITVDAKASRLLIWARPAEHETLRTALDQLDTDAPVETEFKLMAYPIDGVTPDVAAQMIQAELPGLTVIPDPTAKTLIVRARLREHQRIAAMLDALAGSAIGPRQRSVVVYPSIPGDARSISEFFTRAFPSASVLVDADTRRMTIWASAAEHEKIGLAVADMTGTGDGDWQATLKTYDIDEAAPQTVREMVRQVAPNAKLATSADGRQLLAWGRAADHELIRTVVSTLAEDPQNAKGAVVAVFNVKPIGTAAARSLLTPLVPQVTFADAPDGDSLVAWVDPDEKARITAAIEQIVSDKALSGECELRVYDLTAAGGPAAQQVLTTTMPSVSFTSTDGGRAVVAWAQADEHQQIAATLAELAQAAPFRDDRQFEIYSVKDLGPNVTTLLSTLVPQASISTGPHSDQITVTANAEGHKKVTELISRLAESGTPRRKQVAAYDIGNVDPESVRQIMQPLVGPDVEVTVDPQTRRVFVQADPDRLEEIEQLVTSITQTPGGGDGLLTRTYQLNRGEADEAQQVLQALMPRATLVTDDDETVLAATATAEQHALIDSVVRQMTGAAGSDGGPQPMTYPLKAADPQATLSALEDLFDRSPEVSLSVDRPTRTLVAIARPAEHEMIKKLVEQLDARDAVGRQRSTHVYAMKGTDGASVVAVVEKLLEEIDPDAKVAYNQPSRQLIVTTRPEGHTRVQEMTAQLGATETRDVEVFQLERMDPLTARLAIEGIFDDATTAAADLPAIQTNDDSQQLIVRGTSEQIAQIRELLIKMGEVALADGSGSAGRVRVIPIDGDFERAMPRIERIWPRLRNNPLRILGPGANVREPESQNQDKPNGDADETSLVPPDGADAPATMHDRVGRTEFQSVRPNMVSADCVGTHGLEIRATSQVRSDESHGAVAGSHRYDELTLAARPTGQSDSVPANNESQETPAADPSRDEPAEAEVGELPPIVILPGPDSVTIASEDTEALNQLEALLRSLLSRREPVRGRDFTIYALQHAGATTVAETLNELFKQNPRITSGEVAIVPDYRLNALVVYAGRADRERIESLVQTLDSENLPDSFASFQNRIIPVEYADATEVAATLEGIYKAQMTAGGARQSVSIPEGVPSSIASVLRQINAAASSPLLTVEVDETTNSLVLMAPTNLLDEVSALITRLDNAVAGSSARRLKIIPLKKSRSTHVMELLEKIID